MIQVIRHVSPSFWTFERGEIVSNPWKVFPFPEAKVFLELKDFADDVGLRLVVKKMD